MHPTNAQERAETNVFVLYLSFKLQKNIIKCISTAEIIRQELLKINSGKCGIRALFSHLPAFGIQGKRLLGFIYVQKHEQVCNCTKL